MTRIVFLLSLSFVLVSANALASAKQGVVAGIVEDNEGFPLPGARVEIAGPSYTPPEKSGGMGFFLFGGLTAGEYTITVSHPKFSAVVQRVIVRPGETTTLSVQLRGAH